MVDEVCVAVAEYSDRRSPFRSLVPLVVPQAEIESAVTKKKRSKPKPAKRKPREGTNQIAYRAMQEVIKRSER
jgi:hypothetical protein